MKISKGSKQILEESIREKTGTVPTAAETSGCPHQPLCQESHLATSPTEMARKTEASGTVMFTNAFINAKN